MEGKDITVQGPGFTCKYHTMLVMLALDKHSSLLVFWSGTKKNEFYNMIYRCLGYKTFWVVMNALLHGSHKMSSDSKITSSLITIFYQVWCALFYIENDAKIFPVHYMQKVAEKGL
jgi:hypothetical protein